MSLAEPRRAGPHISVVIPTYSRPRLLASLLSQLAVQTFPFDAFEVVVVDDGSPDPVATAIDTRAIPYPLVVERQENGGPAAARHRGAEIARGEILVFIDDDMSIPPTLLSAHATAHATLLHGVILGDIRPDAAMGRMPLFERFHARKLAAHLDELRAGRTPLGPEVCTGNLSLRRGDYFAIGGFDASLGHSEDAELGVRLEKAGATLQYCDEAYTVHGSDRADLDVWLRRAYLYGIYDRRIARKHPEVRHADPWRYFAELRASAKPFLTFALLAPHGAKLLAKASMKAATAIDDLGFEDVALFGTSLAYAVQYMRGLRAEEGSLRAAVRSLLRYLFAGTGWDSEPFRSAMLAVSEDHRLLQQCDRKYVRAEARAGSLAADLVRRAGFQMVVAVRLMKLLHELGMPVAAQLVARSIRLTYGADIHWQARFDPGVVIVHGMGIAISGSARVGAGCILSQNVCLGEGIDPVTRVVGAPTLEERVHVGPGASILGPITIGAGSKVMAGAVVRQSVPRDSLIEAPAPRVRPRDAQRERRVSGMTGVRP